MTLSFTIVKMQVVVWIVIILLVLLIIRFLRKWIKRLIFILILLCLAFFIYGIFSPSGASRLWYNVRTFPQRIMSRVSDQTFLDYDSYKLDISSVGSKIDLGDDIETGDELEDDSIINPVEQDENISEVDVEIEERNQITEKSVEGQSIKAFPRVVNFIKIPSLKREEKQEKSESISTGHSKGDLLGIINKYIEKNLDDDTDILVTVEYEKESGDPEKIIMETQSKPSVRNSTSVKSENYVVEQKVEPKIEPKVEPKVEQPKKVNKTQQTKSSNGLTQKEIRETQEIFSILL